MNNDNAPLRNRRGSSPPFQEAEQGADERMNSNANPERASFDEVKSQHAGDEEARWQDDGGESGEAV